MFVMVLMTYPPDKAVQVARKAIEIMANPPPPFLKRVQTLSTADLESGINAYGIYEVDDAKVKDGVMEIAKRLQSYDIEGLRYEIRPMLTMEEGISLLGI